MYYYFIYKSDFTENELWNEKINKNAIKTNLMSNSVWTKLNNLKYELTMDNSYTLPGGHFGLLGSHLRFLQPSGSHHLSYHQVTSTAIYNYNQFCCNPFLKTGKRHEIDRFTEKKSLQKLVLLHYQLYKYFIDSREVTEWDEDFPTFDYQKK